MTTSVQSTPARSTGIGNAMSLLCQRIAIWAMTCADYFAAAALYDQLRGLSDAELQNRGLSRGSLARDICGACDRTAGR
jgi:hypothetical protein